MNIYNRLFPLPDPLELACRELRQAQRDLLLVEADLEQARAWHLHKEECVTIQHHRIARLKDRVTEYAQDAAIATGADRE